MSKKTKRVIFSFWDGGAGHLIRTVSMAREARKRGFEIGFVSSEKYADWILNEIPNSKIFIIPNRNSKAQPPPYPFPVYSHAFGHAQRLRGLKFDDTAWLKKTIEKEVDVLRQFRPSVIINDYRDTIKVAAEVLGIPIVGVTKSTGNPSGYTFGWWVTPPSRMILPDCRESFNIVRKKFGLPFIQDEREMFTGTISIIPSIRELDPLVRESRHSYYVGLLSNWWRNEDSVELISKNIPKVFSYIGEKTRPQYGYESILMRVMKSLPDIGFYVVGNPERYKAFTMKGPKGQRKIIVEEYMPANKLIPECSVVLSHGGGETVLLALSHGIPVICIGPFTSEQATFFRWVEKQNAGLLIPHSDKPLKRMKAPDLGDGIEIMGYWKSEINSGQIITAINEVLGNSQYTKNAQRLAKSINALGGTKDVLNLVENYLYTPL